MAILKLVACTEKKLSRKMIMNHGRFVPSRTCLTTIAAMHALCDALSKAKGDVDCGSIVLKSFCDDLETTQHAQHLAMLPR